MISPGDSELAKSYDQKYRSDNYFEYQQWMYRRYLAALARRAALPRGGTVLDAGCGQGFFSSLFAKLGFETTGVDLSAAGIAAAQRRYGHLAAFSVGDVTNLEFSDRFDCVFTRSCSLYNDDAFPLDTTTTERLLRYVKPGGAFIFDYHTKLAARKHSASWRYHSLQELEHHFARFTGAITFFSLRLDALVLGASAFQKPFTTVATALARLSGAGGELVAIVRKPING